MAQIVCFDREHKRQRQRERDQETEREGYRLISIFFVQRGAKAGQVALHNQWNRCSSRARSVGGTLGLFCKQKNTIQFIESWKQNVNLACTRRTCKKGGGKAERNCEGCGIIETTLTTSASLRFHRRTYRWRRCSAVSHSRRCIFQKRKLFFPHIYKHVAFFLPTTADYYFRETAEASWDNTNPISDHAYFRASLDYIFDNAETNVNE